MFKIFDGRDSFYQWDINQRLLVEDETIGEVHFCNKTDDEALVCEVYTEDGKRVVNVPNILLQDNWDICIYAFCGYTKHSKRFKVKARSKPADYVYTETEVKSIEKVVAEAVAEAKKNRELMPDLPYISFWKPNTKYYVGDYVIALGKGMGFGYDTHYIYECKQNHLSNKTFALDDSPRKWEFISSFRVSAAEGAERDGRGNIIDETYATKEELGEVAESICRWKANTKYEVGDTVITKYGTVDRMFRCIVEHTSSAKLTENELKAKWEEIFQAARAERDDLGNKISSTYLKQAVASNLLLTKTDAANTYAPLAIVPNFKIAKLAPNEVFPIKPNMLIMAMGEDAERCIELYGNNETKISNANMFLSFSVASNEAIEGDGYIASRIRVGCLYYENALSSGIKNYYIYKPVIKNTSSNKSVYIYYIEQGGNN